MVTHEASSCSLSLFFFDSILATVATVDYFPQVFQYVHFIPYVFNTFDEGLFRNLKKKKKRFLQYRKNIRRIDGSLHDAVRTLLTPLTFPHTQKRALWKLKCSKDVPRTLFRVESS